MLQPSSEADIQNNSKASFKEVVVDLMWQEYRCPHHFHVATGSSIFHWDLDVVNRYRQF